MDVARERVNKCGPAHERSILPHQSCGQSLLVISLVLVSPVPPHHIRFSCFLIFNIFIWRKEPTKRKVPHDKSFQFSSLQLLSRVRLFPTPWTAARQASLSITNPRSLLKLMCIESVMPSNNLILCRLLLLPHSVFPSFRVFFNEPVLHIRWPKYWSFSFISPFNEHSELISFRMDWLDLLVVQGTLKSLLQHHSSKESILLHSAFFIVQLSHPYITTGKNIVLTGWTFVGKVMFLLFNMLAR